VFNKDSSPDSSRSIQVRNKVLVEKTSFSFKRLKTLVVKVISFCANLVITVIPYWFYVSEKYR